MTDHRGGAEGDQTRQIDRGTAGIDVTTPSVARMYDHYLGGKDHYAIDRAAAAKILKIAPFTPWLARRNRAFLARAVRRLVRAGIGQFIDVGTGLPTQGNVHEIAQELDPGARVVYVDNDPVVATHGRALLIDDERTTVVEHDLRRPRELLDDPAVHKVIDFDRPVGLLLVSVLHCLAPDEGPYEAVATLRDALAPGSRLVISHLTGADEIIAASSDVYRNADSGMHARSRAKILAFFDGFSLLEPGLVRLDQWRPDTDRPARPHQGDDYYFCGVGRLDPR